MRRTIPPNLTTYGGLQIISAARGSASPLAYCCGSAVGHHDIPSRHANYVNYTVHPKIEGEPKPFEVAGIYGGAYLERRDSVSLFDKDDVSILLSWVDEDKEPDL